MAKKRVHLTFPEKLIQEPLIFRLATDFGIVTNIRRANVEDSYGWVILEMEADGDTLSRGIEYLREKGVEVTDAEGDAVAG
jgi:L-aspartate semialdehyde sulfurtransferase ferredoxin